MAQRVGRGIALLFHDRGTRRGEWSAARPGRTLPPGKTRYPFYRRLGGSQGRSGRAENLIPTGIRSRTLQPVVSRYVDWATRLTLLWILCKMLQWFQEITVTVSTQLRMWRSRTKLNSTTVSHIVHPIRLLHINITKIGCFRLQFGRDDQYPEHHNFYYRRQRFKNIILF